MRLATVSVLFELGELDVAARRAADAGGGGEPAARVRDRLAATRRALDDFLSAGETVGVSASLDTATPI